MSIRRISCVALILFVVSLASEAAAQPVRVSVATDGTPGNNNSFTPAMSATGRFVAFTSFASNLVSGDSNDERDVFLRDRDTDGDGIFDEAGAVSTVRVSQRGGIQGNGASESPAITPDGHYVVFASYASSLFATGQPTLPVSVVLRWDRLTGDIVLVSQTTASELLLAARSVDPDVSDDGNQIVFVYGGSLQSERDAGFPGVVFRRDVTAATLTTVSTLPVASPPISYYNTAPSISGDGATIAYGTAAQMGASTIGGLVYVVDAASNAARDFYAGLQPRLSRDGASLVFIEGPVATPAVHIHLATRERRRSIAVLSGNSTFVTLSPSGRYLLCDGLLVDFNYGSQVSFPLQPDLTAFDAADSLVAYRQLTDVVVGSLAAIVDADNDGLNGHWEAMFGLNPDDGGVSGATGDPDSDGLTNAQEFARGSHPRGTLARYLAEGATGTFFDTRFAIANPNPTPATVAIRLALDGGGLERRSIWIEPGRQVTIDSRAQGLGTASFSAVLESNLPVVVDRLMSWGDAQGIPYGSHAETSSAAPGTVVVPRRRIDGARVPAVLPAAEPAGDADDRDRPLPAAVGRARGPDLPSAGAEPDHDLRQHRARSRVDRRVGRDHGDAADRRGARDVSQQRRRDLLARPRCCRGGGAVGELVLRRRRDRRVLRHLPAAGQPVGAAGVGAGRLPARPGRRGHPDLHRASQQPLQRLRRRRAWAWTARPSARASRRRCRSWRSARCTGPAVSSTTTRATSRRARPRPGSHWVLAAGEQAGPYAAQTFVLIANTGAGAGDGPRRTLPETGVATQRRRSRFPATRRLHVHAGARSIRRGRHRGESKSARRRP